MELWSRRIYSTTIVGDPNFYMLEMVDTDVR